MALKDLRNSSVAELDAIFKKATIQAAQETLTMGISIVGMNEAGRLVEYHPDGTVTELGSRPSK